MGCSRWGKRCGRSVFLGRPRGSGGNSMRGAGRGASGWWRTARAPETVSGRLQGLVSEFAQRVVAALEQLAGHGQARAVAAEPRGRLLVVAVVGAARASRELGGLVERPAQRGRALARQVPGRAALI